MTPPTRPYWLTLATPGSLVHAGVCVREDWEDELAGIFSRAHADLERNEPLISAWQFRSAHQPLMSAVDFCNAAPFADLIEASSPVRTQAIALDESLASDPSPESWQLSYAYRDRRTSCAAIYSARLLAPRHHQVSIQKFFMAFTAASKKAVDLLGDTRTVYGWAISRQMEDPFLTPQEIIPAFRSQLDILTRSGGRVSSEDGWSRLNAMHSEMQALFLRSSAPDSSTSSGSTRL